MNQLVNQSATLAACTCVRRTAADSAADASAAARLFAAAASASREACAWLAV